MTDLTYIVIWWLFFFLVGVINLPLTYLLLKNNIDIGYGFSKTISTLLITFAAFLLAIFKIAMFTTTLLYLLTVVLGLANLIVLFKIKPSFIKNLKKRFKAICFQEILFTCGFIFWSLVRGHHPDIEGLEKFMDYGFINSILKSDYLPPIDMWFSGEPINYYWFGHLWTAVLTKLTLIPSAITYNLMIATILGFCLTAAFSISATLFHSIKKVGLKKAYLVGILSALLLTFAGNFQTAYYFFKNKTTEGYWYPDATRFIGYNPETNDKTIHEFPLYSFVVSDLHAHLLNLPFVLLFIALLANTIFKKRSDLSYFLPLGFLLGIMFMTNTWDFANYLLLTGITFMIFKIREKGFTIQALFEIAKNSVVVLFIALIVALPFIVNFTSIAQGVKITHTKTPVWQLFILWGFPFLMTTSFLLFITKGFRQVKKADLFVVGLLTSSWILIALPEFIYVKDIYIASHYRANTMFKLTYQAFVMFYLSSGYIVARTINLITRRITFKLILAFCYLTLLVSVFVYPFFATDTFYGHLKTYEGLDGETWLATDHTEVYRAIVWFRMNEKKQVNILEAPGDSYTTYNSISAHTGNPTISGWFVHEWLWRGDSSFPQNRVNEINTIYTTGDANLAKSLLDKYNVQYVVVGKNEKEKYSNLEESKFTQFATPVFVSGSTIIYKVK